MHLSGISIIEIKKDSQPPQLIDARADRCGIARNKERTRKRACCCSTWSYRRIYAVVQKKRVRVRSSLLIFCRKFLAFFPPSPAELEPPSCLSPSLPPSPGQLPSADRALSLSSGTRRGRGAAGDVRTFCAEIFRNALRLVLHLHLCHWQQQQHTPLPLSASLAAFFILPRASPLGPTVGRSMN